MTRIIPQAALDIVTKFEGCELVGYLCPAGIPTIGFGHTGPGVKVGQKISLAKARVLLHGDLGTAAERLEERIGETNVRLLTDNQYSALISFVFNLGANKSWTIWKKINAGDFDAVPAQIDRFVYADGMRLKGLVRRRAAERALWIGDDDDDAAEDTLPSSTTRNTPTPPEPAPDAKPITQSKTMWAGVATTVAGGLEVAKQVQATVAPEASHSPLLQGMMSNVAVLIVALGVAIVVFRFLDERAKRR